MIYISMDICELCYGKGYWKSNTGEYEGDCPNGCAFIAIKLNGDKKLASDISSAISKAEGRE